MKSANSYRPRSRSSASEKKSSRPINMPSRGYDSSTLPVTRSQTMSNADRSHRSVSSTLPVTRSQTMSNADRTHRSVRLSILPHLNLFACLVLESFHTKSNLVSTTTSSVHYDTQCPLRHPVSTKTPSVHYDTQCPLRHPVSTKKFSVHYDTQCPLRNPVSTTTPSVHYEIQCPLQHPVSTATLSVHYKMLDHLCKCVI